MSSETIFLLLGAVTVVVLFRAADPFGISATRRSMRGSLPRGLFAVVDCAEVLHRRGMRTRTLITAVRAALREAGIQTLPAPVFAGRGLGAEGNLICVVRGFSLPLAPLWLVVTRLEMHLPRACPFCGASAMVSGWSSRRLSLTHDDSIVAAPARMLRAMLHTIPDGFAAPPGRSGGRARLC